MATTTWLDTLCDPKRTYTPVAAKPWRVYDADGNPWVAATDSRCVVYVRSGELRETPDTGINQALTRYLTMHPGHPGEVAVWADMKAWLGAWKEFETCPKCKGASISCPHHDSNTICNECFCDECESCGEVGPPMIPGVVAGVKCDLNVLARFTAGFSGEEYDLVTLHAVNVQLSNVRHRRGEPAIATVLVIDNPYWRVVQAEWNWDEEEGAKAKAWDGGHVVAMTNQT